MIPTMATTTTTTASTMHGIAVDNTTTTIDNKNNNNTKNNNNLLRNDKEERLKRKRLKKRLREIEKEAALRTLNGNGCDLSLPPLPSSMSEQQQQHQHQHENEESNEQQQQQQQQHPYGILPHGNIYSLFLDDDDDDTEKKTNNIQQIPRNQMGPYLSRCNDSQLTSICAYLSGTDLSNLVCCNRFCYVLGHLDELWRDVTLRKHEGGSKEIEWMSGGWKDTFVHEEIVRRNKSIADDVSLFGMKQDDGYEHQEEKKEENVVSSSRPQPRKEKISFVPHKPIQIQHIYSDTFYRPYLCRTFPLPKAVFTQQTVPTVNYDATKSRELTIQDFLQKYEETNTPLLIKGATRSWPAFTKWKDLSYLEQQTMKPSSSSPSTSRDDDDDTKATEKEETTTTTTTTKTTTTTPQIQVGFRIVIVL